MLLQEDLEQRTVSVSIQAAKLSGRVLRAAIAAVLQKMEQECTCLLYTSELNEMEKKLLFQVEGDYQTKILNELYMTVRLSLIHI